jgi:hypothetical protein
MPMADPLGSMKLSEKRSEISTTKSASKKSQISKQASDAQPPSEFSLPVKDEMEQHPYRIPDNSDNMSSVSFNTGFLIDQFQDMDSISQFMTNNDQDDSNSGAIDLKNVGAEL